MSALTEDQRRLITELLTQKPFECNHVFFFGVEADGLEPMDDKSRNLYGHYQTTLDALPGREVLEGWPGNIISGTPKHGMLKCYASYLFGDVLLVVSKDLKVDPDQQHLPSPFNKYFVDAICASISPIVGTAPSRKTEITEKELDEDKKSFAFTEFEAWRQCRDLWQKEYPGMWLAIKDGMPRAKGKTLEELDQQVLENGLKPPILYAPPEGEEKATQILSSAADQMAQAKKRRS
jgi:hypothetical protein